MHSVILDSVSEDLSTSPIFPCRQQTGQQSAVSSAATSGSVSKLQDADRSSTSASPWLSKEHGISNGKVAMMSTAQSGYELHSVDFILIIVML